MGTFVEYQKNLLKLVDELESAQSIQNLTDKFREIEEDNSVGLSDVRGLLSSDLLDKVYVFLKRKIDIERERLDPNMLDGLCDNSKKDSTLAWVIEETVLYNAMVDLVNKIGEFLFSIQEVKNEEECLKFTEIADLFSGLGFKLRSLKRVCGCVDKELLSSIPGLTPIRNF